VRLRKYNEPSADGCKGAASTILYHASIEVRLKLEVISICASILYYQSTSTHILTYHDIGDPALQYWAAELFFFEYKIYKSL